MPGRGRKSWPAEAGREDQSLWGMNPRASQASSLKYTDLFQTHHLPDGEVGLMNGSKLLWKLQMAEPRLKTFL